jgi:ABC-type multidrug transport system permease subunit
MRERGRAIRAEVGAVHKGIQWPEKLVSSLRLTVIGGLISYRALFNFVHPSVYVPTMLVAPLFQLLFFAELGQYSGVADARFYVVGNAVMSCGMSCLFAMSYVIANERYFGTLLHLLASRASRSAIFLGRMWPVALNGFAISLFTLAVGSLILNVGYTTAEIAGALVVLVVTVCSCSAFGLVLGAVGLQVRDVLFGANMAYMAMLLLCGVEVPASLLPGWLRIIGDGLPLTHGIQAIRIIAGGQPLWDTGSLILAEGIIGVCYLGVGYVLIRVLERASSRVGTFGTL